MKAIFRLAATVINLVISINCSAQNAFLKISDLTHIWDKESVVVSYQPTYIVSTAEADGQTFRFRMGEVKKKFITFPVTRQVARIAIYSSSITPLNQYQFYYLIEAGDNVNMSIYRNTIFFSGRGAGKYNLINELNKAIPAGISLSSLIGNTQLTPESLAKARDSLIGVVQAVVKKYNKKISPLAADIISKDFEGKLKTIFLSALMYARPLKILEHDFKSAIVTILLTHDSANSKAINLSIDYVDYIYFKEKVKLFLTANGNDYGLINEFNRYDLPAIFSYESFFKIIKDNFSGYLRERLLTRCVTDSWDIDLFFKGVSPDIYTSCLQEADMIVQDTALKSIIAARLNSMSVNALAFNFSFQDSLGNVVSLEDLKGKVVLLDIWSNPCGGCMNFKRDYEKYIVPELNYFNDKFITVSINCNEEKARWLSGVNQYSEPEFLNLWVGELGMRHPMVKHYKVNGVPKIILIDQKGRIISATLPWTNIKEMLELIKKRLG